MDAAVKDRIVVESERATQSGRARVIEEVLAQDPRASASAGQAARLELTLLDPQVAREFGRRPEPRR